MSEDKPLFSTQVNVEIPTDTLAKVLVFLVLGVIAVVSTIKFLNYGKG